MWRKWGRTSGICGMCTESQVTGFKPQAVARNAFSRRLRLEAGLKLDG